MKKIIREEGQNFKKIDNLKMENVIMKTFKN